MKLRFAFLGLLSLIAVSCSYEETFVAEDNIDNSAVEFYATIDEQPDADTKVYADDQLRVLWNADDRITIFNKNTYNQQYRFTGVDGDNAGGFRIVKSDDEFITSNPLDNIYAVYPYRETNKISNDGVLTTSIPLEQTYKVNSFGIGANTMVSVAESNMLKFRNVGGYLSLKFYGEGVSVSSITLKSNNGEFIAGDCTVDMSSGLPVSNLITANASDAITMVCDPPIELPAEKTDAVMAIFVLFPGTLTGGITVTVNTADGGVFEKSTGNKLEIGRSAITRLGALEVIPEYTQPNNVIYYTSTDGNIVIPYKRDFGANIISNEYVGGRGVLIFDDNVTTIGTAFLGHNNLSSISLPSSVTKIDAAAFCACSNLVSINIPELVTSIEAGTFMGCTSLASLSLPNSIVNIGQNAFYSCISLKTIEISESLTSIEIGAFYNCVGLESINIPASVTSIERCAFSDCSGLSSIAVNENNKTYDSRNNCNAIIKTSTNELVLGCKNTAIPNSVTGIGDSAFDGCTDLVSIFIPNSVTIIDFYAFRNCNALSSISIPDSVIQICSGAFECCSNLVSITIPESISSFGYGILASCPNLYRINGERELIRDGIIIAFASAGLDTYCIPEGISSIGEGAFSGCNLSSITIPESVSYIGGRAFEKSPRLTSVVIDGGDIGINAFRECYKLSSVTLGDSVTNMGAGAFRNCTSLTSLVLPDSVTSIESGTFQDCNNLISVALGNSLVTIGQEAFAGCFSLESINIPASVERIDKGAFNSCNSMTSIIIPQNVISIGEDAFIHCNSLNSIVSYSDIPSIGSSRMFEDTNNCPIYVPAESVEAYKAAEYWSAYADRIQAIPE